jgi:hypothetical protein
MNRDIHISATHENVTGVKVVWYPQTTVYSDTTIFNDYNITVHNPQTDDGIKIPVGISTWTFSDNVYVLPTFGVVIKKSKWEVGGKLGAIPFTFENHTSNSFVAGTVTHMVTPKVGFNSYLLVTWEYLTASDEWTEKAAGISTGLVVRESKLEMNLNGMILNQVKHDEPNSQWYFGLNFFIHYYIK